MSKQVAVQELAEPRLLVSPPRHLQSPEARMLGETLVSTINAHLQRYPVMNWAEVRAVLRVLEQAAAAEMGHERDTRIRGSCFPG